MDRYLRHESSTSHRPQRWVRAHYEDPDGKRWKELDVSALIQDEAFLEVSV